MECPLKRLGAAWMAGTGNDMISDIAASLKSSTKDTSCKDNCAWYLNGKCALTLLAAKEVPLSE